MEMGGKSRNGGVKTKWREARGDKGRGREGGEGRKEETKGGEKG